MDEGGQEGIIRSRENRGGRRRRSDVRGYEKMGGREGRSEGSCKRINGT